MTGDEARQKLAEKWAKILYGPNEPDENALAATRRFYVVQLACILDADPSLIIALVGPTPEILEALGGEQDGTDGHWNFFGGGD